MRSKSNKIQFIALAFIMLFSVMNAWSATVYTDLTTDMFHMWDGVGAKASQTSQSVIGGNFFNNVGNGEAVGGGGCVIGTGTVDCMVYADLSEYQGIRIKLGNKSKTVRLLFNRCNMNGDNSRNGMIEYTVTVNPNKEFDINFSDIDVLKGKLYYHLNSIKFGGNADTKATIPLLQVYKSDDYVSPCGNGLLSWSDGFTTMETGTFGNAKVNLNAGSYVYSWNLNYNNFVQITGTGQDLSTYDNLILRTEDLTPGATYRLHVRTQDGKEYYYETTSCGLISIPLSCELGQGWISQTDGYKPMKMDPSMLTNVQIFLGGVSVAGNNNYHSVKFQKLAYAKSVRNIAWDENHCFVLTYDDFVKQGNFKRTQDGGILKEMAETSWWEAAYAYPVQSNKTFRINGTDNQLSKSNYQFVENVIISNRTQYQKLWTNLHPVYGQNIPTTVEDISGFQVKFHGTGTIYYHWTAFSDGTAYLVSYDTDGGSACYPMECVVGVDLPETTKQNFQFAGWYDGSHWVGNAGDTYHATRNVTLKAHWVENGKFNPNADRVFFLDFEGMTNANLVERELASTNQTGADYDVEKGAFYNYGGNGRILNDPVFGQYYQNLAVGVSEYTESKAQNFMRYVLTDKQQKALDKIGGTQAATIGFWVNGKIAIDYEFPLERGSMFCMMSDQRFRKANAGNIASGEEPRFMFDISCNGWVYSYMPNSNEAGETIGLNRFFYGNTNAIDDGSVPSMFGTANYADTRDQRKHKFYDDRNWHYITYVATNDMKYVTMYVDGVKTGEKDMTTLGTDFCEFEEKGDYSGRVFYLRNLVLGGFTPHGLFFEKQYFSDAALAYDDIAIYSKALSQDEIQSIIAAKNFSTDKWNFKNTFTATNGWGQLERDVNNWDTDPKRLWNYNNPFYSTRKNLNNEELTAGYAESGNYPKLNATVGMLFTANAGDIIIDKTTGLLGLKPGVQFTIPNIPKGYYIRFISKAVDDTKQTPPSHNLSFVAERQNNGFKITTLQNNVDNNTVVFTMKEGFWFESIEVTPYREADMKYSSDIVTVEDGTFTSPTLSLKIDSDSETDLNSIPDGARVVYSSSAPHIAYVNPTKGDVTLSGIAGYATIKAELVSENNIFADINGEHRDNVSASYEIRVVKAANTHVVQNGNSHTYSVGQKITIPANGGSNTSITMTMGGWEHGSASSKNSYNDESDKPVIDAWTHGYGHVSVGSPESIDGFSNATQGAKDAKDESYGVYKDDKGQKLYTRYGNYNPVKTSVVNSTPWQLPCRGSYLKFEPEKAGVLTVYVLQNGCLEETDDTQPGSDHIYWRPVYIADETGKLITDIECATNSVISPNDSYFLGGRRRAQFIRDVDATYNSNPTLRADLLKLKGEEDKEKNNYFSTLIGNWENVGWKQKIIETDDGGYMVISKGIVRYTFNVYPGKSYYIFSNQTKLSYSGYNFEEGKLLPIQSDGLLKTVSSSKIELKDLISGTTDSNNNVYNQPSFPNSSEDNKSELTTVTYDRTFTPGKWGSICLPFSMNNKQMKENFGDETAVVLLKEIDSEGVVQMVWHVNQDIIAGYPYFILPRGKVKGADVASITQINTNAYFDPAVTAPSFMVGPKMKNSQSATVSSVDELGYTTSYPYVFTGNFATETATAGSYVMLTSGVLTKVSNTPSIKPFRAYLRYCEKLDPTKNTTDPLIDGVAEVKPLSGMGYKNTEGEETTTSVEQILEANGIFIDSANVYGVDGQVKRYNTHDMQGLPKGVYIVNGKKYVVK